MSLSRSIFKFSFPAVGGTVLFLAVRQLSIRFFESDWMGWFIWNINTFRGMFANLPNNLPQDSILSVYALAFEHFYTHSHRTVAQNSSAYALISGALTVLFLLWIFLRQRREVNGLSKQQSNFFAYLVVILSGLFVRLFFAYHTTGNQDIAISILNRDLLRLGKDIYSSHWSFTYSPFWLLCMNILDRVNGFAPQFSFMFVIRSFTSLVDLATLLVLGQIAIQLNQSPLKTVTLFFLNPIPMIISGYHGQIDGIPILMLLIAIYLFLRFGQKSCYWGWLSITLGMVAKHEIPQQCLIFLTHTVRSRIKILLLFSLTIFAFLFSFLPYWENSLNGIVKGVFGYGGVSRPYGFMMLDTNLALAAIHKYSFIFLLLCWPFYFRTNDLVKSCRIGMLLFLVFTSGISAQQFVLPIALAALQPSFGFFLFTGVTSLFLLGNVDELKVVRWSYVNWNYVWGAALIWFVLEVKKVKSTLLTNV